MDWFSLVKSREASDFHHLEVLVELGSGLRIAMADNEEVSDNEKVSPE